jgi:hypothetical protein
MPSRCDSGDSFHLLTSDWHPRLLHAVALRLKGGRRQAGGIAQKISKWVAPPRPVLVLAEPTTLPPISYASCISWFINIPIPSVVICVHPWLKKHPSRSRIAAQMELRPPKNPVDLPSESCPQ